MLPDDFVEVLSVPIPQQPKTAKELDAAIDRFRAACGDVIPELERDEPEPDLDAILPCMDEGDSCVGGHGRHCPAFYRPAVARLCAERAPAGGWQPIDTAPTKGRIPILLWRDGMDFPQTAFANTWWTAGFSAGIKPTHWMKLAAPTEGEK